jgi:hypothetical protein
MHLLQEDATLLGIPTPMAGFRERERSALGLTPQLLRKIETTTAGRRKPR